MTKYRDNLSRDRLAEILDYNEFAGVFTPASELRSGSWSKVVGSKTNEGYINICVDRIIYRAHRLAWLHFYGTWPDGDIDHINGVKDDNRIENLRCVSHQINCRNQKIRTTNKSGVTGVRWVPSDNRWIAYLSNDYLGYFDNLLDAVCARKSAEVSAGYHANHGRVE